MRAFIAVVLAATPAVAEAKLEIRDVQASHGQFGPVRTAAEYVAGDQVYFRYTAAGVRADDDGRVRAEIRMKLVDAKGKVLLDKEAASLQERLALGGDTFSAYAALDLSQGFPAGEYELTVEFTDLLANEKASFRRKFAVKPPEFAVVRVRFSHDEAGATAAAAGGMVGQTLVVHMKAVGFDRGKGEFDVEMQTEVLDASGKPVMPRPIRAAVHNEKPEEVKEIESLRLWSSLTLNRPGDFVLRVSLTDKMTKKKVTFETPLKVSAP
jgi:hypothetical protein